MGPLGWRAWALQACVECNPTQSSKKSTLVKPGHSKAILQELLTEENIRKVRGYQWPRHTGRPQNSILLCVVWTIEGPSCIQNSLNLSDNVLPCTEIPSINSLTVAINADCCFVENETPRWSRSFRETSENEEVYLSHEQLLGMGGQHDTYF